MELRHQFTVPAPMDQTWAAFNDPQMVVPCFPGATLISVEGDTFTGSAKVRLGPISLQYTGTGTYLQRDEVTRLAVIEARGRDKRGNGTASAKVTAQLRPDGDGTSVHVTTDLSVTGKPAQFGRGVMQDVSDNMLQQFVACLQAHLTAPEAPASPSAPAEAVQATDAGTQPGRDQLGQPAREQLGQPDSAGAELNLLSAVVPIVLRHYAGPLLGIVGLALGYLLGRRHRRAS